MVRISFLDNDDKTYRFMFENIEIEYLNALRRIISYNLPIYAVDEIDFIDNDSVLVDEMIANRIGLCPINTPAQNTGKKVTLEIEKEGPCTVFSSDLVSGDREVKSIYNNIPITKLNEGEKLKLECCAVIGIGAEHVKFSPAIVSYMQMCELELGRGCNGCEDCVKKCPKNCLEMVANKPVLKHVEKCDGCMACVDACESNCMKINNTSNFIFSIELIGQCSIESLVQILKSYTKEYIGVLKKKLK